mmetsp:Transcript_13485/g.20201  ORF Transcript_13485/g.20201 Transcript_13485/m.20201 type:complete len:211 (+) Transcript_13485:572-1204(+)
MFCILQLVRSRTSRWGILHLKPAGIKHLFRVNHHNTTTLCNRLRWGDFNLHLEPTRSQKCWINQISLIRESNHQRRHNQRLNPVHLRKQLIHYTVSRHSSIPLRPGSTPSPTPRQGIKLIHHHNMNSSASQRHATISLVPFILLINVWWAVEYGTQVLLARSYKLIQDLGSCNDGDWSEGREHITESGGEEGLTTSGTSIKEKAAGWLDA